jgi:hypothetical protein
MSKLVSIVRRALGVIGGGDDPFYGGARWRIYHQI